MFPVSEDFLREIQENTRQYYWTGSILTTQNVVYDFTGEDIVKGSGYISRQCAGNSELEIGSVYASELALTLIIDVDRYTIYDAEVTMYFHLILDDGTEERIPMGIFEVSEANRHIKTLEIKAYDYMLRFDKTLNLTSSGGSPYEFLSLACIECDVELAQTKEEIGTLPNSGEYLGIYSDNDISTYRDLIFYVAQVLGCVCQINREGKLEILPFTTNPVVTIPTEQRYSSSYSDFVTRYTALSFTNLIAETSEYYPLSEDDGLTLELGSNPLLQYGLESTREKIFQYILEAVSAIKYTPFDSTVIGNPALDPMDVLTFSGGHADETQISCITNITYKIGGKQTLKCVGKNPKLAGAKSKLSKELSGLLGSSSSDSISYYHFTNASPFSIRNSATEIISIEFASTKETSAMFQATVILEVTDVQSIAEMNVIYELNMLEYEHFQPVKTYSNCKDFLTLFFPLPTIDGNSSNNLSVSLKISDGLVTIGEGKIKATISGQGLVAGQGEWDGKLEIVDTFENSNIDGDFGVEIFDDTVEIDLEEDIRINITDKIVKISVDSETMTVDVYLNDSEEYENCDTELLEKVEEIQIDTESMEVT